MRARDVVVLQPMPLWEEQAKWQGSSWDWKEWMWMVHLGNIQMVRGGILELAELEPGCFESLVGAAECLLAHGLCLCSVEAPGLFRPARQLLGAIAIAVGPHGDDACRDLSQLFPSPRRALYLGRFPSLFGRLSPLALLFPFLAHTSPLSSIHGVSFFWIIILSATSSQEPWNCESPKKKCPKAVPTHLQKHVVWSRILKCSVKPYVPGPSTTQRYSDP